MVAGKERRASSVHQNGIAGGLQAVTEAPATPSGSNACWVGPNANRCDPFGVKTTQVSGDARTPPEGSQPLDQDHPDPPRP